VRPILFASKAAATPRRRRGNYHDFRVGGGKGPAECGNSSYQSNWCRGHLPRFSDEILQRFKIETDSWLGLVHQKVTKPLLFLGASSQENLRKHLTTNYFAFSLNGGKKTKLQPELQTKLQSEIPSLKNKSTSHEKKIHFTIRLL
jgi:hypothetical protein